MRTTKIQEAKSILFCDALEDNSRRNGLARLVGCGLLAMLFAASRASAQTVVATVATGNQPQAVAVNPVTDKIYIVNDGSANVTVIDGASNTTSTVAVGSFPVAAAVVGGSGAADIA
jgi:hypothetical protein